MSLPRRIERVLPLTLEGLANSVYRFAEDVFDALRSLPVFERYSLTVRADDFPITLLTELSEVDHVVCSRAVELNDESRWIPPGGVAWRMSESRESPGITIESIDGLPTGTDFSVRMMIVGRRT